MKKEPYDWKFLGKVLLAIFIVDTILLWILGTLQHCGVVSSPCC